jgi:hypothetical protein
MTAHSNRPISALFLLAALYDGGMGAVFLLAPGALFRACKVPPPNHMGYVQFPAALLLVFALMFLQIARNSLQNRELIVYGILLKVSYCGLAFWYWFTTDIPTMWKPFAVIDLVMAFLFIWAYGRLGARSSASVPTPSQCH